MAMAVELPTQKVSSAVSCFVAKCTETVIEAVLHSGLKDKYIRQFSESNPIHREAIRAFLYEETHYVLPAIKHKDRGDFVRLYAVLCSALDKTPLLLEAMIQLYPKLPSDSKCLSSMTGNPEQIVFSIGMLSNRQDYIALALSAKTQAKKGDCRAKQQVDEIIDWQLKKWRDSHVSGFMRMNPYASALLLYSSWSNDSEACLNAIKICQRCTSIVDFAEEFDVQVVANILSRSSFKFTVASYTKDIRSGLDLISRIQSYFDVYTIADVTMDETLASYAMSSINALCFADYIQPRTGIGLLFGKEVVTKEDRYLALRCALFQYHYVVESLEQRTNKTLERYGDFNALARMYASMDILRDITEERNPLYDSLPKEAADIVMDHLRSTSADCVAAKFEETYLLALYKILVERIIIREQREELEAIFFAADSNNTDARNRKEVETLYLKCDRKDEEIKTLKERLRQLEQKVDSKAQHKRNIERKNAIITELRSQVENLEWRLEQKELQKAQTPIFCQKDEYAGKQSLTNELSDEQIHEELKKLCCKYVVVLVDGHENFHRRLSEAQPNIRTLSGEYIQRKSQVLATADFVFCKSSAYGSHSAMSKAISETKGTNAHFILLSKITNIEQCEKEIYTAIVNCVHKEGMLSV